MNDKQVSKIRDSIIGTAVQFCGHSLTQEQYKVLKEAIDELSLVATCCAIPSLPKPSDRYDDAMSIIESK